MRTRALWILVLLSLAANGWLAWRLAKLDDERWLGDQILRGTDMAQDKRLDALEAAAP